MRFSSAGCRRIRPSTCAGKSPQKVGDYDLSYITTADYDYMLRALALNDFRVRYLPRIIVDFQIGGISTAASA